MIIDRNGKKPDLIFFQPQVFQLLFQKERIFFLDGEEIVVAGEGDLIKKRYKVVRIGVTSVEVEDTQFNHTQMLPLAEEAAG